MKSIDGIALEGSARDCVSSEPPFGKGKGPAKSALPRRLCSLADAARYLAVSDWTVRQMVWRGDLPHFKTGKRVLLDLRDLEGWIDREKTRDG
jgi:excisionase family DNA binding protein